MEILEAGTTLPERLVAKVRDLADLQVYLANIKSYLIPSSAKSVLSLADMPPEPSYRAAIYLELIRVASTLRDAEHAMGYYKNLLAEGGGVSDTPISEVPFMRGFSAIDTQFRAVDVAKSLVAAACSFTPAQEGCADAKIDSDRPSLRLISNMQIVSSLLYRGRLEDSQSDVETALTHTNSITNDFVRSYLLSKISIEFSKMHHYAKAKEVADKCLSPEDKIRAYSSLVLNYHS